MWQNLGESSYLKERAVCKSCYNMNRRKNENGNQKSIILFIKNQ